jgi:hypothetical protein
MIKTESHISCSDHGSNIASTFHTSLLSNPCHRIIYPGHVKSLLRRHLMIGTRDTAPHGLGWPKEGSNATRNIIQKISEDHDVLHKA